MLSLDQPQHFGGVAVRPSSGEGVDAFPGKDAPRPFNGHTPLMQQGTNTPQQYEVRIGVETLAFRRAHGAQLRELRFPETQDIAFQLQEPRSFPDAIGPSSHTPSVQRRSPVRRS